MIVFPNAKINIGLNILSKREDGYHNISSCFYPVPFCDVLEIIPSEKFEFVSSGIHVGGEPGENLCVKAFRLLQEKHAIGEVKIHLHKVIPMGAGLGGGSADATYTLKALDQLFKLGLSTQQLEQYAAQLGSDCPFFVENKPVMAQGTGTEFTPSTVDLEGKYLVLLYPGLHVSTQEAYSGVKPQAPAYDLDTVLEERSLKEWSKWVKNDFEDPISSKHTIIQKLKTALYDHGAIYASMTGSGSAIYGVFEAPLKSLNGLSGVVWEGTLPRTSSTLSHSTFS